MPAEQRPASLDRAARAYHHAQRLGDPAGIVRTETWLLEAIRHINGTGTSVIEGRLVDQVLGGAS